MSAASCLNKQNGQKDRHVDWCVEVLRCCLVEDAVVIDDVGHVATAVHILLFVEPGSVTLTFPRLMQSLR